MKELISAVTVVLTLEIIADGLAFILTIRKSWHEPCADGLHSMPYLHLYW